MNETSLLLLRASLLLALAWLGALAVRRAGGSAAMRHQVWLAAMAALLLLPLAAWLAPPLDLPILPGGASPPPASSAGTAAAPAFAGSAAVAPPFDLAGLLRAVYLLGLAALLARILFGYALLARLWRRAAPVTEPGWRAELERLARTLRLGRPVGLRAAPGLATPMSWGLRSPRILVPADALSWPAELRRAVLLHELAHVARRDSLSRAAAACICALYWFHPAIWYAARRLRLEQEHACDDLVLAQGAKASFYARSLLEVAAGRGAPPASLCVAMARPSELEQRLRAIIGGGARQRSSRSFALGVAGAALAATLLAAALSPVAAGGAAAARGAGPRAALPALPAPPPPPAMRAPEPGRQLLSGRPAQAPTEMAFQLAPEPPAPPAAPTPPVAPLPPRPPTPPAALGVAPPPAPPVAPTAPIAPTPPTPPVAPAPPVAPVPPTPPIAPTPPV
jgi:beta-lactamase regulating signal transducer with metallopeptidase domain